MKKKIALILVLSAALIYAGCRKSEFQPEAFSQVPNLPATTINYGTTNDQMVTLGRVLFYDKKMSLNNTVACGSCHRQSHAFCDNQQFSKGLQDQPTRRNTPSIINHSGPLFWDGRANTYYQLAAMPLANHVEMYNYDMHQLESKIASISYYPQLFNNAFGDNHVTMDRIQKSIALFLQMIDFQNNKVGPMALWGGTTNQPLTGLEEEGRLLFVGKAKCANCHSGPAFSGWQSECIGLDESYTDNGVGELTDSSGDKGRFNVPPLFNIEYTAPYMHDGRFKTLEEVVEHYNSGIKNHPNLSWQLKNIEGTDDMTTAQILLAYDTNHDGDISESEMPPATPIRMNLSEYEKKALVAFLKALSDPAIFTDTRFSDPFRVN